MCIPSGVSTATIPAVVGERVRPWAVVVHVAVQALLQSTWMATQFALPVVVKKTFEGNNWQTLAITAAPTVFFVLSVFWNAVYTRMRFGWYLLLFWACSGVPMAVMGLANGYWWLLAFHVLTCIGAAAIYPATGELLKGMYPDAVRGRVYGVLNACSMIAAAGIGFGLGKWLTHDEHAYKVFLPIMSGLQLLGVCLAAMLGNWSGVSDAKSRRGAEGGGGRLDIRRVLEPLAHMRSVLKADPIFARYEGAYMTYGAGWMIGYALLPMLVVDKLQMAYDDIAERTHVAYLIALVLMLAPAGYLMDRLGAMRSVGLSFAMLTAYPILLLIAPDADGLLVASVVYGVAHAGAQVGWMLGPVSLAPSADKTAQYVAIHATLVGVRGIVLQFVGVALYEMTGSFVAPLCVAAGAYAWSAVQMWQLDQRVRGTRAGGR